MTFHARNSFSAKKIEGITIGSKTESRKFLFLDSNVLKLKNNFVIDIIRELFRVIFVCFERNSHIIDEKANEIKEDMIKSNNLDLIELLNSLYNKDKIFKTTKL